MTKKNRRKLIKKIVKRFGKLVLKYGIIAAEIYLEKELEKLNGKIHR